MATTKSQRQGCWYFVTIYECPLCCATTTYRERRDGPKPAEWHDRHEYLTSACGDHFM